MRRLHPAILILLLLVVFALGFFLATTGALLVTRPGAKKIWDTANVVQQVQTLSQLVTVKYVMEKVVVLEDPSYLGTSRVIMVAHGVLKAGVDFAPFKPADVQISGNKISLVLPPARLIDAYLDEKLGAGHDEKYWAMQTKWQNYADLAQSAAEGKSERQRTRIRRGHKLPFIDLDLLRICLEYDKGSEVNAQGYVLGPFDRAS